MKNKKLPADTDSQDDSSKLSYAQYVRYLSPSQLGFLKGSAWRKIHKVGEVHGLPHFAGTAFATNGILVAIRLASGEVVIGHLDSFEQKPASGAITKTKRLSKLEKLAMEFA